jgi:hypothetical protein
MRHATGSAHPRNSTLTESTVTRSPSVLASRANARRCSPCHLVMIPRHRSATQVCTCTSRRFFPRVAPASSSHSRTRWRSRPRGPSSTSAHHWLTWVIPHLVACTMASLQRPRTVACARLRLGRCSCTSLCQCALVEPEDIPFPFTTTIKTVSSFSFDTLPDVALFLPAFSSSPRPSQALFPQTYP